jgi:hypothetical protein
MQDNGGEQAMAAAMGTAVLDAGRFDGVFTCGLAVARRKPECQDLRRRGRGADIGY